ncbi:MAG TPA: hypothetical protein VGE24_03895 [Emticicia sp.]
MQEESEYLKSKGKLDLSNEVVRALWWKQPYASAMLIGKVETRTWETKIRGKVLICASQKGYSEKQIFEISGEEIGTWMYRDMAHFNVLPDSDLLGHAIAIGDLVDCRPMRKEDESDTYVQYCEGLWCHIYQNVQAIKPFPIKGAQGWRILTDEQKNMIELL